MEQSAEFNQQLFQVIMERQQMFDSFLLPKLQEEYRITQSAARTIQTVLLKKGILHDEPYKYDSKITDIEIPPEDTYTEGEKASIIGRRIAQYEQMIDVVNNNYQFNCDFLTTERISKLVNLNRVFTWESFSPTSTRVNTRGLAELINNVRSGSDPLSISILNDALTQLSKSSITITKQLKSLTDFHRERYKAAVRKLVLPGAEFEPPTIQSGHAAALKEIKRSFAVNMKNYPFYTELVDEILKEDYSPEHAVLQQELLSRLAVVKQGSNKTAAEENFKPVLLDGIRTLGSVSPQLDDIIAKLAENNTIILNMDQGFLQRFVRSLRKAFNRPEKEKPITITAIDPVTQSSKHETIKFPEFIDDLKRKSRIYTAFSVRTSPAYQKVETMDEQQILDLLTRHVAELSGILKQAAGLDEYFKQTAIPEVRDRIRGIKIEISAIRNSLVKANQCRAEYASQVEEQQQLKKLGITNV